MSEQNTPTLSDKTTTNMSKRKPSYRELQFRRWIKEVNVPISMNILGLLNDFNQFLWNNAKSRSKSPLQVQVTLFAFRKWVHRLPQIKV